MRKQLLLVLVTLISKQFFLLYNIDIVSLTHNVFSQCVYGHFKTKFVYVGKKFAGETKLYKNRVRVEWQCETPAPAVGSYTLYDSCRSYEWLCAARSCGYYQF